MIGSTAESLLETIKKKIIASKVTVKTLALELESKQALLKAEQEKREKAEAEVAALQRRIRLLEDDLESTDTRLTDATAKLEEASKAADESERLVYLLTCYSSLFACLLLHSSRKLAMSEVDLERAESRLEAAERKILDLEDELRIVGNNMKSLEISEQEAAQREEAYEENIRDLTERLKAAEDRAQDAERLVHTLQGETDRLEGKRTDAQQAVLEAT
ncbi:unnamed protein product [Taenia asiatica]|uniref:Tropomyosin n=1 Tax=Taenia asiatica TaxID=60517 RepID=A0A0R3W8F4_TAEAS|nr:unnamed protein product [Taenia asiatica]